jgi:cytochrome c-type biogenesis protein CcmF
MPWLTATAFLHSAMVMERKDQLRGWTISLLLATFLLTILGTFMTRSGVFNSVHSFTQSPIGPAFLTFLGIALAFSVVLLAARVDKLSPAKEGLVGPASREIGFLVNNLLFAALTFTVLIGTVYPLLNEWVTDTQISVGQPYFDRMAAPLGVAIVFMMGVGPVLPWGRSDEIGAMKRLLMPFVAGLVGVGIGAGFGIRSPWVLVAYGVSGFALAVTLKEMVAPVVARMRVRGEPLPAATLHMLTHGRRRFGGYIVHIGVIMIAVAHSTATSSTERYSVTVPVGQATALGDYVMTFTGSEWEEQPHRRSLVARFNVERNGEDLGDIAPRLNHYAGMGSPIGTPEVHSGLDEDLYVSLINVDEVANVASIQVLVEPLVWWLWFGGGVMMVGTIISAWPSRRRRETAAEASA